MITKTNKLHWKLKKAISLKIPILICVVSLSICNASALTIDENSPYYVAPFNGVWNDANWSSFFSNNSGTNSFFTWDNNTKTLTVHEDILIKRSTAPGAPRIELSIDGSNSFDIFMDGAKPSGSRIGIQVNAGEFLELTNGVSLSTTRDDWSGISATGLPLISQFDLSAEPNIPPYYDPYDGSTIYNTNQTMVTMEGSSEIFKALIALHSANGAIIRAAYSKIEDCRTGVKIENYTHPTNPIADNLEYKNASYLEGMTINLNQIIDGAADYGSYYAVYLNGVHGIHIAGCTFENLKGSTFAVINCSSLGIGVYAYNSSLSMHKSGASTYDPISGCVDYSGPVSKVKRFSQGIYSIESASPPAVRSKLAIQENTFDHNLAGIIAVRGTDYAFKDNIIHVETSINWPVNCPCSFEPQGISLTNVNSFGIYHNTIWGNWDMRSKDSPQSQMDLIKIDNCGSAKNKIQANTIIGGYINGIVETGLRIIGLNDNLEPWCDNRFERLDNGILIEAGATPNSLWGRPGSGIYSNDNVRNTYTSNVTDLANYSASITYVEDPVVWAQYTIIGPWSQIQGGEALCTALNCKFWTPLPITKISQEAILIYPNPSNGSSTLFLQSEVTLSGELVITDITGKQVQKRAISPTNDLQIDVSNFKKGTYFIQLKNNPNPFNKVFIIN